MPQSVPDGYCSQNDLFPRDLFPPPHPLFPPDPTLMRVARLEHEPSAKCNIWQAGVLKWAAGGIHSGNIESLRLKQKQKQKTHWR